jgi:hypothetical protein
MKKVSFSVSQLTIASGRRTSSPKNHTTPSTVIWADMSGRCRGMNPAASYESLSHVPMSVPGNENLAGPLRELAENNAAIKANRTGCHTSVHSDLNAV